LAVAAKALQLREQGIDITDMALGEPDFDTAICVKEAAIAALQRGETKYPPVAGTRVLRQAIVRFAKEVYGIDISIPWTMVTCGAKQALYNAMFALFNPEDEVLCAAPYWTSYPAMVEFTGARFIPVLNRQHIGELPTASDFDACLTSKTKGIILNSPNNPTGAVYTQQQIAELAQWCKQHPDIWIISDDIYYGLVFDHPFTSIIHADNSLKERTIIISGVSKTYAMTGWRVGFAIAEPKVIQAMSDLQSNATSGICNFAQAGAAVALDEHEHRQYMLSAFSTRRQHILKCLETIPHIQVIPPKGAFYAFINIKHYLNLEYTDSVALADYLLNSVHLACVAGEAFGAPGFLRLSYACSTENITEGISRLGRALSAL
jgi:aspartate aminotransferase